MDEQDFDLQNPVMRMEEVHQAFRTPFAKELQIRLTKACFCFHFVLLGRNYCHRDRDGAASHYLDGSIRQLHLVLCYADEEEESLLVIEESGYSLGFQKELATLPLGSWNLKQMVHGLKVDLDLHKESHALNL